MSVASQIRNGKAALTEEKILGIVARKGSFHVNWQYRNEWLVRRCKKLCSEGKLRLAENRAGSYVFKAPRNQPNQKTHEKNASAGG